MLQARQRPRSQSQPKIGTLSYHRMGVWHSGQWLAGRDRLMPLGSRQITTLRKLPQAAPQRNA